MKIIFQGQPYTIAPADMAALKEFALSFLLKEYQAHISGPIKPLLKFEIRQELYKLEKKWGKELCRPPKDADPAPFALNLILWLVQMYIDQCTLEVAQDGSNHLKISRVETPGDPGEAGGQLADLGDARERKNDVRQVARAQADGAVS